MAHRKFYISELPTGTRKISIDSAQLSVLELRLGTTSADYEKDHITEVQYFKGLRSEPPEVQQTVDYIDVLQKLSATV
jgi:hypothetical protein